jgi:hypothetical protein
LYYPQAGKDGHAALAVSVLSVLGKKAAEVSDDMLAIAAWAMAAQVQTDPLPFLSLIILKPLQNMHDAQLVLAVRKRLTAAVRAGRLSPAQHCMVYQVCFAALVGV